MREPVYSRMKSNSAFDFPSGFFEPGKSKRTWDCKHPRFCKDDKLYQTVSNEFILYHCVKNRYFFLNMTDTRVWLMLNNYDADLPVVSKYD